jgi:hypothetical protein
LWRLGSRLDLKRAHNPKVAGSNPAPATIRFEGLADVEAASPFRLPRLHPGIGNGPARRRFGTHRSLRTAITGDAPCASRRRPRVVSRAPTGTRAVAKPSSDVHADRGDRAAGEPGLAKVKTEIDRARHPFRTAPRRCRRASAICRSRERGSRDSGPSWPSCWPGPSEIGARRARVLAQVLKSVYVQEPSLIDGGWGSERA